MGNISDDIICFVFNKLNIWLNVDCKFDDINEKVLFNNVEFFYF